jgi:DNA-directed RNA polymerase specialized sigma24 family protein
MSEQNAITGDAVAGVIPMPAEAEHKALDLAVLKKGAKDFLTFVDDTKEVFYAYLYHRTCSLGTAQTLMSELYLDVLSRAMSLWWFGTLSLELLLEAADKTLGKSMAGSEADVDSVYVPALAWLNEDEKKFATSLHESLWTLPVAQQRLVILSLLLGFSNERIATVLGMKPDAAKDAVNKAVETLVSAWQPSDAVRAKLQSLVFMPGLDIRRETNLRFAVVEKYNALRMRKYQWVVVGAFLAVFSNLIVAGVLAFVVVVQSPSSLRGTRAEVAALDALLLKREIAGLEAKRSLNALAPEARGLAAYDTTRKLTTVGLSAALNAFEQQGSNEAEVDKLIKLLERSSTAMAPAGRQIAALLGQPVALVDVAMALKNVR